MIDAMLLCLLILAPWHSVESAHPLISRVSTSHVRLFAAALANDSAGAFIGASSNGSGLYQSDDTGRTWKHLGWQNPKTYSMDIVQATNGRTIYEACGNGVIRSTDAGRTWKLLTDWRISEVTDVEVSQLHPTEISIATAHGAYCSRNSGKSWEALPIPDLPPYITRIAYSANYDTLFVTASNHSFFRTTHSSHWSPLPLHTNFYPEPDLKIIHLPQNIEISNVTSDILIGRIRLYGSLDGGIVRVDADHHVTWPLPRREIWRIKSYLVAP